MRSSGSSVMPKPEWGKWATGPGSADAADMTAEAKRQKRTRRKLDNSDWL